MHPSPRPPRFPLLGKALTLGAVLLALTVALQLVGDIVAERQGRLHEAERSVADSLASAQVLVGPVLQRRCVESWTVRKGEGRELQLVDERREFQLVATPGVMALKARAAIEPRHRGIFTVNGYALRGTLDATWPELSALVPRAGRADASIVCDAPVLAVAVADVRGLRHAAITVDGRSFAPQPGSTLPAQPRGLHAVLPEALLASRAPLHAVLAIDLVGTGEIALAPVGESTRVDLASDWPHPSFTGRFLPTERTVGAAGFTASWQLSALATSAPTELRAGAAACAPGLEPAAAAARAGATARCVETFGVAFIDPVSGYVLSDRAAKYGLLFIALTFVGVGLVEVMRRLRVHPIQYLLVGSAIALFFLLLVSLTEHVAFAWAYLAASAACTLLIGFYGSFVLRGWRAGSLLGAAIAVLYGALFVLLQLEQGALVLGSVLLFAVLAAVMAATRHVDWYALFDDLRRGAAPA